MDPSHSFSDGARFSRSEAASYPYKQLPVLFCDSADLSHSLLSILLYVACSTNSLVYFFILAPGKLPHCIIAAPTAQKVYSELTPEAFSLFIFRGLFITEQEDSGWQIQGPHMLRVISLWQPSPRSSHSTRMEHFLKTRKLNTFLNLCDHLNRA